MSVIEIVGTGVGAVVASQLFLPQGNPYLNALVVGAGSAAGSAAGGFMDDQAGGAKYLFNVQNAATTLAASAALYYVGNDILSGYVGEIPSAFLIGVTGDMISQKLPNIQTYIMKQ